MKSAPEAPKWQTTFRAGGADHATDRHEMGICLLPGTKPRADDSLVPSLSISTLFHPQPGHLVPLTTHPRVLNFN